MGRGLLRQARFPGIEFVRQLLHDFGILRGNLLMFRPVRFKVVQLRPPRPG